jgi:hypothetical protein
MADDFRAYRPPMRRALTAAVAGLREGLRRSMPLSAAQIDAWLVYLARSPEPADYFLRRPGSPMFLFPWFVERSIHPRPDTALQASLIASTVSGYYYIRLIDNLTDRQDTVELGLLPALGFFHTHFQFPYQRRFPADHAFWEDFAATWLRSADVTVRDLALGEIDRAAFEQVSSQKTCAVKIPVAAVCHSHGRTSRCSTTSSTGTRTSPSERRPTSSARQAGAGPPASQSPAGSSARASPGGSCSSTPGWARPRPWRTGSTRRSCAPICATASRGSAAMVRRPWPPCGSPPGWSR